MSKKIHYIAKNSFSGCISNHMETVKFFTNERECHKRIIELKKENTNKFISYWYDFEWKSSLEKKYSYLFENGFNIDTLNNNLHIFKKTL